jgi:hypothetical protein
VTTDKYGRKWNLPKSELCPKCGQPDSCGDCNHKKLTIREVLYLGGNLTKKEIIGLPEVVFIDAFQPMEK